MSETSPATRSAVGAATADAAAEIDGSGPPLVDGYDAALFDLDGVIYLGPVAVPGAAEVLHRLRERGTKVGFVTNNAARTPEAVAEHLRELHIPATAADVVTSAQAGAHLLLRRFGAGARVLVAGGGGLWAAVREIGLTAVFSAEDDPVAVIQGWAPELTWEQINEAAIAIQRGAYWVATNTDLTRPTNRGIVPGNGAAVAAVRVAVAVDPEVAGKPYRPLMDETTERLAARRPIFIGDRLDTDIEGAIHAGLDSLLVLTGAHGPAELLSAPRGARPTHLGWDVGALLEPALELHVGADTAWCAGAGAAVEARVQGRRLSLVASPDTRAEALAGLWAAAHLAWREHDAGRLIEVAPVLRDMTALR
jgi:glycerol-1-phosphatase